MGGILDLGQVVGPQGPQGNTGPQGVTGANGITPNIQVGTVTTLDPGSDAYFTRQEGSPDAAPVFDVGLPRGADSVNDGDMKAAMYDPTGKAQDIFAYADEKAEDVLDSAKEYAYSKEQSLSAETAALYEDLTENPVPDDVFALIPDIIYMAGSGTAKVTVSVKLEDGTPVPDACISTLKTKTGEDVLTDQDGKAIGYVQAGSRSISVSDTLDITSNIQTISAVVGKYYAVVLTAQKRNFAKFTASASLYISGLAKRVDVSVGGAGGGGGWDGVSNGYPGLGGGGGGGYAKSSTNVSFSKRTKYPLIVGAAGNGGTVQNKPQGVGSKGGNSSFLGVSANGGNGANKSIGGTGNGNGASGIRNDNTNNPGSNGTQQVFSSFTDTSPWGGGGGGGTVASTPSPGGSPGGGNGAVYGNSNNTAGTNGGGGGGGAVSSSGTSVDGKPGGNGVVAARIYFEEDLAT